MNKSEYYTMLNNIVSEGYGWEAIQDLTRMMCKEWNECKAEVRELRWKTNTVQKFLGADMTNKQKLDAIADVLGEDGEA